MEVTSSVIALLGSGSHAHCVFEWLLMGMGNQHVGRVGRRNH